MSPEKEQPMPMGAADEKPVIHEDQLSYWPKERFVAERIPMALEKLVAQKERLRGIELRPRVGVLADADKIENQQIDVIDATDEGKIILNFKLTSAHYEALRKKLETQTGAREASIEYGKGEKFELTKAWALEHRGISVKIAKGEKMTNESCGCGTCEGHHYTNIRSSFGLVQIEIPAMKGSDQEEIEGLISEVFADVLDIPSGLAMPEKEAEQAYKIARFVWHHKRDPATLSPEEQEAIAARLERQEVFPGYFTMVDPGKHKEYKEMMQYAVFHTLHSWDNILDVVRAGGLISSHERYRRGLIQSGLSSSDDLIRGGGDSVFTRIFGEKTAELFDNDKLWSETRPMIVFDPDILDRTDWYAYGSDRFGSTDEQVFLYRLSPTDIFLEYQGRRYVSNNEQMFRLGIPVEKMKAVVCGTNGWQEQVRSKCKDEGISTINGEPLEQLLHKGVDAFHDACEKEGLHFLGGVSVETNARDLFTRELETLLKFTWGILDYEKLQAVKTALQSIENFTGSSDSKTLRNMIEAAGIAIAERRLRDWVAAAGAFSVSVCTRVLKAAGIHEIEGLDTESFVSTRSRKEVGRALADMGKLDVVVDGSDEWDRLYKEASHTAIREAMVVVRTQRRPTLDTFAYRAPDIHKFLLECKEKGVTKIGGMDIRSIDGDWRDKILEFLRNNGITEVNGKPVEDFIAYAKRQADLIDIANDKPPRSMTVK